MKIGSMGDRVRPGRYAAHAHFARSVLLFDDANRALFVVDRSIGSGPLNLVVADPGAFVQGATLDIPRHASAPRFDSTLPRLDRAGRARLFHVLETALPRHAPAESLISLFLPAKRLPRRQPARDARFQKAFTHFAAGRLAAGVRLIRGCGEGLTPSGDDFLCGMMLACRLRRKSALAPKILENARGQNPVSNAFLEMAAQGRVNAAVKKFLQSPSDARVGKVCDFGHNSGADLLCGLLFGLRDG
jgi:hypothetical protein